MKLTIFPLTLICLLFSLYLSAQEESETEVDPLNQSVIIKTEWKPSVQKSDKINELPAAKDQNIEKPTFNYSITSKPVETSFSTTPIQAAKMKGEPLTKLYRNLVTVGFGTPATTYANLKANSDRSSKHSYGLEANHFSSAGKAKLSDTLKQETGYSYNYLNAYAKKFGDKFMMLGGLDVDRTAYRYYGYDTERDTLLEKKEIKQRFFGAGIRAGIQNINAEAESFKYSTIFNTGFFNDYGKTSQLNAGLHADLSKLINDKKIGLGFGTDYYNITKGAGDSLSALTFEISPRAELKSGEWVIKAGFNTYSMIGTYKGFKFFPDIQIDFHLAEIKTLPYLFFRGNADYNDYRSVSEENPFIYSSLNVAPSFNKNNVGAGIRGTLMRNIPFLFEVSYKQVQDMHLYVNNYEVTDSVANKFGVIYDNANLVNIRGEIGLVKKERFKAFLKIAYTSYSMENEEKAWHMPSLENSLSFQYNMQDKIIANLEIFHSGKRYSRPVSDSTEMTELKGYLDANIHLEYRYTKILSIFVHLNNITNTKYAEWNYYPGYKLNTLFGLSYAL